MSEVPLIVFTRPSRNMLSIRNKMLCSLFLVIKVPAMGQLPLASDVLAAFGASEDSAHVGAIGLTLEPLAW